MSPLHWCVLCRDGAERDPELSHRTASFTLPPRDAFLRCHFAPPGCQRSVNLIQQMLAVRAGDAGDYLLCLVIGRGTSVCLVTPMHGANYRVQTGVRVLSGGNGIFTRRPGRRFRLCQPEPYIL